MRPALRAAAKAAQAEANFHYDLLVQAESAAGEVARKAAAVQDLGRQIAATETALKAAVKRCQATQDVRQQLQAAIDELAGVRAKVFSELNLKPLPSAPVAAPTPLKPAGQSAVAVKPAAKPVRPSNLAEFFGNPMHGAL